MLGKRIKPDLSVPLQHIGSIGHVLKYDYDNAKTQEHLIELVYKWLADADETTNTIYEYWYTVYAYFLYSYVTGRSYDTKQFYSI